MPRIVLVGIAVLAALAALSVGWHRGGGTATAAAGYAIDVQVSDDIYTVACDGVDSFRITATVTLDGAPVGGAEVHLGGGAVVGYTNRRGVLNFDYAPPRKDGYPKTYFIVYAVANGNTASMHGPWSFSCPFPPGSYELDASLFVDRDADGARDRDERALAKRDVQLSLPGHTWFSTIDRRTYQLDGSGHFGTALDNGGWDAPHEHWTICLMTKDQHFRIASVNGAFVATPGPCVELTQLAAGANSFSIGVVRK